MTGLTYTGIELNPKRLELLHEALPRATRFAALGTSKHMLWGRIVDEIQTGARSVGVQLDTSTRATYRRRRSTRHS
jgi:hypothetical protein